jgi:hypothetical protein
LVDKIVKEVILNAELGKQYLWKEHSKAGETSCSISEQSA